MKLQRNLFSLPAVHEDAEGNETEWLIVFSYRHASGDGWNEPRDPGGPEFEYLTTEDGGDAPDWLLGWAQDEFERRRNEAAQIVADADDAERADAADLRRGE